MKSKKPDCSIVIATHQRLPMLKLALASALAQRDVDIEVIVVENGSSDGTPDYLNNLTDPRVVPMIFEQPLGATQARNEGLRAATGEWVGFLDDDDLWAPLKLRAQLDAALVSRRNWAYTGCVYIDKEGDIIGGVPPMEPKVVVQSLPQRYAIPGGLSSMIWRSGILDQDGLLEPRLTYAVDWDLSQRLLRTGLPAAVPEPLVAWRQHGANMSVRAGSFISELSILQAKFADLRQGRPLDVAYQYRIAGSENMRAQQRKRALMWYGRALLHGDLGSLARASAFFIPHQAWPYLRRRVLSNDSWMRQAEGWVGASTPA